MSGIDRERDRARVILLAEAVSSCRPELVAEIHQLKSNPIATNWMCSACGVDAGCNCGAPLMSKGQRAAEAIRANPMKSDRAIASELGVGRATVQRAREVAHDEPPEESERIGRDGKSYPARRVPTRSARPEITEDSPSEVKKAFLFYAHEACLLARYDGPIDREAIDAAIKTAAAWQTLTINMKEAAVAKRLAHRAGEGR